MKQALTAALLLTLAQPALAARLTISSPDRGGSVVTEDGNLQVKQTTKSRNYTGWVVLHTNPWRGYRLRSWSGDCSGRAPICRVRMNRARFVRASWEEDPTGAINAYTANNERIGRVIGGGDFAVSVLTDEGYTAAFERDDGNLSLNGAVRLGWTGLNCDGTAYIRDETPGGVWLDYHSGATVWSDLNATKQSARIFSSFQDGECESNSDGWLWEGLEAKYEDFLGRSNGSATETGLPADLPFEPLILR